METVLPFDWQRIKNTASIWLRKPVVIALIVVLGLLGGIFLSSLGDPIRSLLSIQKIDPHPVYQMTFHGDYHFRDYLKTGINVARETSSLKAPAWGCTVFAALNPQGEPIFGRNFDWDDDPILVLKTDPPDGFASISLVDARYLGLDLTNFSSESRLKLLDAPYLPFDGMNEMGLAVGMMAVPVDPPNDPQKITIGSLQAIRLMLDYAKDVDQAVALIGHYNIDFSGGPGIHYLVADRQGHSVVIEFNHKTMNVIPTDQPWQVSTNFNLAEITTKEGRATDWRYHTADQKLASLNGQLPFSEAMPLLKAVSQPSTLWSVVYNLKTGQVQLAIRRKFDPVYPFQITMKP